MAKISKRDIRQFRAAMYDAIQEGLSIPTAWMEKMFPGWKRKKGNK